MKGKEKMEQAESSTNAARREIRTTRQELLLEWVLGTDVETSRSAERLLSLEADEEDEALTSGTRRRENSLWYERYKQEMEWWLEFTETQRTEYPELPGPWISGYPPETPPSNQPRPVTPTGPSLYNLKEHYKRCQERVESSQIGTNIVWKDLSSQKHLHPPLSPESPIIKPMPAEVCYSPMHFEPPLPVSSDLEEMIREPPERSGMEPENEEVEEERNTEEVEPEEQPQENDEEEPEEPLPVQDNNEEVPEEQPAEGNEDEEDPEEGPLEVDEEDQEPLEEVEEEEIEVDEENEEELEEMGSESPTSTITTV